MSCLYHPSALRDVYDAVDFYDGIDSKLGDEFLAEFKKVVATADETPTYFPMVSARFRKADLSRFPYHVLFEEHSSMIRIVVVKHHKRNPDYGLRRR